MALLDKFIADGSNFNSNGTTTPKGYDQKTYLNNASLVGSSLDRDDGATPPKYDKISKLENVAVGYSALDLDSKTPKTYI